MKTIGVVILLAIFLIGAYEFGTHQTMVPLVKKVDSLQRSLRKERSKDSLNHLVMDTLKEKLSVCQKKSVVKIMSRKHH